MSSDGKPPGACRLLLPPTEDELLVLELFIDELLLDDELVDEIPDGLL